MSTLGLQLSPGTLNNPDCYPSTPQALYAEMFEKGRALTSTLTGIILSATAPAATDRDKAWFKVSAGHPIGQFAWDSVLNAWLWPNPYAPSGPGRMMWAGSIADLATFDGGDASADSVISGPMWEVDTDFAGLFPLAPGTINGVAVPVNQTGGSVEQTLTLENMPPHSHTVPKPVVSSAAGANVGVLFDSYSGTVDTSVVGGSGTPPAAQPFVIVPPYRSVYIIKRTSRVYYRG